MLINVMVIKKTCMLNFVFYFLFNSDSPEKFGGPYCMLVEISPQVKIIEGENSLCFSTIKHLNDQCL